MSDASVAARARQIGPARAWGVLPPASGALVPQVGEAAALDISVVAVADRAGNVFAATPRDGAADGPAVPGPGFVISTRGSQSHAEEGHPAAAAPGRRPGATACPMLRVGPDGRTLAAGGPGGYRQLIATAHVLMRHLHRGLPPDRALAPPRVFSQTAPQSASPHLAAPGRLQVEDGCGPVAVAGMAARVYRVGPAPMSGLGTASVWLMATGGSAPEPVGDPRRDSGQILGDCGSPA